MIKSLRESKARLSELVEKASRGEDVLITVRGRVKARLTRAGAYGAKTNMKDWAQELRRAQQRYSTGRVGTSVEQILTEEREDRY